MGEKGDKCASCGKPTAPNKWVCRCGHILELALLKHTAPSDQLELDVEHWDAPVDDGATVFDPSPYAIDDEPTNPVGVHDQITYRFDPMEALSELFMGRVVAAQQGDIGQFAASVGPIDLYVLGLLDGTRGMGDITRLTGLKKVEPSVVLLNLLRGGAITTKAGVTIESSGGTAQWNAEAPQWVETTNRFRETEFKHYEQKIRAGDVNSATLHLKRAVAVRPDVNSVKRLEEHVVTVVKDCDQYYSRARYFLSQGETTQAMALLTQATRRYPAEAGFYNLLAVTAMHHDRHNASVAREYLERAVTLDPSNRAYKGNLTRLDHHMRD